VPFARGDGADLYYEVHGEGTPVLFCHGAGSNAATWWQQLPAFAPRHRCITVDLRCFGRSRAPLETFTVPVLVADALAVLDAAGAARAVVVGQSLGGMVGLQLALRHPERVAGFVACDSSLAIDHAGLLETLKTRALTHAAVSIEQRSLGRWFLEHRPALAALYAQINHFNPSAYAHAPDAWRAALARLHEPGSLVPMDALRRVACPTLLLVGREDPIVPASVMHEVAARVAGSEVVIVDDAGHSAYFEQPDAVNRHVLEFIARRVG